MARKGASAASRKRSLAAKKGWKTRQKNEAAARKLAKKRSAAARRGWATRRKNIPKGKSVKKKKVAATPRVRASYVGYLRLVRLAYKKDLDKADFQKIVEMGMKLFRKTFKQIMVEAIYG